VSALVAINSGCKPRSKQRVFLQLVVFSLLWLITIVPALAAPEYLRIPVFFVTDRNLQPSSKHSSSTDAVNFGPNRKYLGECKHEPFMGMAYCVIPNIEGKELNDRLKQLGWEESQGKEKEKSFKATLVTGKNFGSIQKDFYEKVHSKVLLTEDKNLFVFTHGYKNAFQSGLYTACKLAYYAERPLIYYSWPSACKFRSYASDENNVEWSQEHYNEMITKLDELCTADPLVKVRLFAHSMGSRLLVRASPLLREKSFLIESAVICPDIDDGVVQHYVKRYLSANSTTTIRVYMSRRDKALAISQVIHGGYCRLGECADSISGIAAMMFTPTNDDSNKVVKKDDPELVAVLEKINHRMQTIDFTALDQGIIGHKIPDKLICSMSFTGGPYEGITLVPEESGLRSKLSNRLTHRMLKQLVKLNSQELSVKGTCLRVVKLDKTDKKHIANAVN
jgi:esterase/lipase superfamily enzyme